jgi:DNA-binding response OmpR family regulator
MTDDPRVLIVDDEADLAELYATWLGEWYTTSAVYTGADALDRLGQDVDVVILDRRLRDTTGAAVVESIAELDPGPKVAMLSAVPPGVDVIGMGFDTYVTKPVSKPELRAIVDDLLAVADFDEPLQELYALVETRAAIDAENSSAALDASEDYARLEARISTLRAEIEGNRDGGDSRPSPMAALSRNPMETD